MSIDDRQSTGRLLPSLGRLLPPSLPLMDPHGVGAIRTSLVPGAAARSPDAASRRLQERVRMLRQRAREAAAAHAPELRRQALAAAGIASIHAARTARQATGHARQSARAAQEAWSARSRTIGMRWTMMLGAGASLCAIILLLLIARQHADSVGRARVAQLLDHTGLRGVVLYKTLSASPFGAVTLNDVTLRLGSLQLPVRSIGLDGIVEGVNGPIAGRLTIQDALVPIAPVARSGILGDWPVGLLGLGVVSTRLNASVRYRTNDTAETLTADVTLRSPEIGRALASVQLGGVDTNRLGRLISLLRSLQASQAGGFGLDVQEQVRQLQALLGDMSWLGGTLTLDDSPLRGRALQVTTMSVPGEASDAGLLGSAMRIPSHSFDTVLPSGQADAARETVQSWLDHGGRLVIRSNPPTPVGLFPLHSDMDGLSAAPASSILSAAGLSIDD